MQKTYIELTVRSREIDVFLGHPLFRSCGLFIVEEMQEVIDTHGFFVRHGRQRRAALFPVPPPPETEVDTSNMAADGALDRDSVQQLGRQRRKARDDNKVYLHISSLSLSSVGRYQ